MPSKQLFRDLLSNLGLADRWISRPKQSVARKGRERRRHLGFESLEGRVVLSASPGALISGVAFADVSGNHNPTGQPVLTGVTVTLFKDGGNGTFDGGVGLGADDTQVGAPTTTDGTGHYNFSVSAAGTYFVKETAPSGYVAPTPTAIVVSASALNGITETTIDTFTTQQSISADQSTVDASSTIAAPEAIGGHRDLAVHVSSASGQLDLAVHPNFDPAGVHLLHFDTLGNGGIGTYTVSWDGSSTSTPPALDFPGLNGVSLITGGATGITLSLGADHDGATATFTIYKDASNFSIVTVPVPGPSDGIGGATQNLPVFIPFSSFGNGGGTGAGDFSSVDAIQLAIGGGVAGLNGQVASIDTFAPTPFVDNLDNTPEADLQITKTDGKTDIVPGTNTTYTIVVTNAGPNAVTGAAVADAFPAAFTGAVYSAVATGGATGFTANGSGNISDTVNMPVGSTITYTVSGSVSPNLAGTLVNTATVTAPNTIVDPNLTNNSATDSDNPTPQADLGITKTDGKLTVIPGTTDTYTIVVSNGGPSAVTGATVTDFFPAAFTNVSYTAVATGGATGFTASGSSNINDTVNMPVGSTITYTVTGTVSAALTQDLTNQANVNVPQGTTDTNPQNNQAIDTDRVTPTFDLSVTKTDGKTFVAPGASNTYTIVVTNSGPSVVTGASVSDFFPVTFTGATYTATATGGATNFTASGSGDITDSVNMPVGSTITYIVTGTISAQATGTISNTVTVVAPEGTTDSNPNNNSATDTDTITNLADMAVTKTDGKTTVVPGTNDTYTIVVTNNGPTDIVGGSVVDAFPAIFTGATYTAVATGGATGFTASGSGNINDTVNMPLNSTITYTVTGAVSASATGTLVNTATVAVPVSLTDPTPANNTATDTDILTPQADLSITKTDGKTTVVPGTIDTYTIVVTNSGPSVVTGAAVGDSFPLAFTGVSYTATATGGATGFTASGSGNINDTAVNMPVGSTITYTVTGTVSPSATGTLVNTATVTAPQGTTDPTPANNTATDTDTLTPQADLTITKTDNKTSVVPGTSDTYTIVVSNLGPSAVTGATVGDTFPVILTGVTYTAVPSGGATGFTASGSGTINDTVNMPVGSTITYTVTGTVSPSATGTLVNTATVAAPQGTTDPTPANNTATDTDTLTPQADLSITKTDNKTTVVPGTSDTYTIVVANSGPSAVTGATVADTFPATFTGVTYTAVASGGATGFTASGSGNINDTAVNMPVGSTITYTVTGTVSPSATGTLVNTATVAAPQGTTDPTPANNSATDTDVLTPQADLSITKTDNKTTVVPGTSDTYTIVVTNTGPSAVTGATVADTFPATFTGVTYTAVATGGATGFTASGSGNINDTAVNMPVGSTVTYTVTGTVSAAATGSLVNTATVTTPQGVTDPTPANNTATDTDTLTPQADLSITKTDNKTLVVPGTTDSYTIVVTNSGPSVVTGATVADTFPSTYTGVTYTATATGGATGFTASGSGNINDTAVNMPVNSTITYVVTGTVNAAATGTLVNTATVTAPEGTTDPTPANNTATDTDTMTPQVDLVVTKTDGITTIKAGNSTTYTIVITNAGPSVATGASIVDTVPAILTGVTFTATATGGATGFTASGTGSIDDTNVTMPVGSTITYTVTGTMPISAKAGTLTNTVTASVPEGLTDTNLNNNTATDTDTVDPLPPLSKAQFLGRY